MFEFTQHSDQAKRLSELVRILARYGLADWLGKIPLQSLRDMLASRETQAIADMPTAQRLRLAFDRDGNDLHQAGTGAQYAG